MKTSIIKLKPIPNNTVVHTPTEEEAKELLEILHENRYTWRAKSAPLYDTNWHVFYSQTVYFIHSDDKTISAGNMSDLSTLTLAEFKERFLIEEDNPQPNLCELLRGHEGESLYSPVYGNLIFHDFLTGSSYPVIVKEDDINHYSKNFTADGKVSVDENAGCLLFPSRALYEQYPLDAKKAWEVWQEEQKIKCRIWLSVETKATGKVDVKGWEPAFDSTADRDKAIEEIKAIIEKYNKK